jgi:hypothetical protein
MTNSGWEDKQLRAGKMRFSDYLCCACGRLSRHSLLLTNVRRALHKAQTIIACRKIKLIVVTETVLIPHGGKSGTHDGKSGIGLLYESRIVLEMRTVPAYLSGIMQLNGVVDFHALMRNNGRPVMTEYDN